MILFFLPTLMFNQSERYGAELARIEKLEAPRYWAADKTRAQTQTPSVHSQFSGSTKGDEFHTRYQSYQRCTPRSGVEKSSVRCLLKFTTDAIA